jgi:nucleotide-binding universal stress UspA family protein
MPHARSILCPVDFSDQSRRALVWAMAIARHRGATLTVLSVLEPLLTRAAEIRLGIDLVRQDAEPALRAFVDGVVPVDGPRPSLVRLVTTGEPSDVILTVGHEVQADLIVMGTHGRGGLGRRILGSTTADVLSRTRLPILAVPVGAGGPPTVGRPGVRPAPLLVATDFGESAMKALQWAVALATDVHVPLVLAHVVAPVTVPRQWRPLAAEFEEDRVASGQRMLAALAAGFPDVETERVVSVGTPADTIAALAVEHAAGLVVLGLADGPGAGAREPGAIAYHVLRQSHAAVAVVPPSEAGVADEAAAGPAPATTSRSSLPAGL